MTEPSVLIVAKCPNGHETQMFPEKCIVYRDTSFPSKGIMVEWDCPVCPIDGYQHQVFI